MGQNPDTQVWVAFGKQDLELGSLKHLEGESSIGHKLLEKLVHKRTLNSPIW